MKNLLAKFVFVAFLLTMSPLASLSCSLARVPISKFPSDLYVFIGEVVGYTDKFTSKKFYEDAYGLKIKPLESVNLPKESNGFYEVFPFGLAADCGPIGYSKKELQEEFPINSKVRITAIEAQMLSNKNKVGQIRLEAERLLGVYRNDLENDSSISVNTFFDYADWKKQYNLLEFELLKDLKRLEQSSDESEKIKIFERLVFFPSYWFDFDTSIKTYIKDSQIQANLINKRRNFEETKQK